MLFFVLITLLVITGIGYRVYSKNKNTEAATQTQDYNSESVKSPSNASKLHCKSADTKPFSRDVTDFGAISLIETPIRVVGDNNIKTHSYVEVTKRSPVYAPMDATLNGGANYYETMGPQPVTKVQYILSFDVGCDVNFWLDHLVDVPDKIKNAFPVEARNDTQAVKVKSVSVKAGELVGYSNQEGRARFDFGAVNLKGPETILTTDPRFKDNPIVKTSDKYRFATCPYNLYSAQMQEKYRSLYSPEAQSDQELIKDICQ